MTKIERINPDTLPDAAALGYAQIVTAEGGKMVFISGQVAWTVDGASPPSDLAAQSEIAVDNLKKALAAVAADVSNVVSLRIYVVDYSPDKGEAVLPAILGAFGSHPTATTVIGVASLADPSLLLEIEAIAVV